MYAEKSLKKQCVSCWSLKHPYTNALFKSIPDLAGDGNRLYTIKGIVPSLMISQKVVDFEIDVGTAEACTTQPEEEVSEGHLWPVATSAPSILVSTSSSYEGNNTTNKVLL